MTSTRNHILISILFAVSSIASRVAHNCESTTFDFNQFHNRSHQLDLKTPSGTTIAEFEVSNLQGVFSNNNYLDVKVESGRLVFRTTKAFESYEKEQSSTRIILQIQYSCTDGNIVGNYYQDLLQANNYDPEFSRSEYEAIVPLPLPKNFDLSPYIQNGQGIIATDYDLVNNTITFSLESNDYFRIESVPVSGSFKSFRAIIRLQEQILKLADNIELDVRAQDKGVPARSSSAKLHIRPDLNIVYNDPPIFKQSFIRQDYKPNSENAIALELIPGTEHEELEYSLLGDDKEYFELSVGVAKNNATLSMKPAAQPPKGKYFLNVIVQAKRSELLSGQCVVLIDLKEQSNGGGSVVTVEKTFAVIHLEEERTHSQVFPAKIGDCWYEILNQHPRNKDQDIFMIDRVTEWIVSDRFDREDSELFADIEQPQFKIVLKLICQESSAKLDQTNQPAGLEDISFSTDTTHLTIIVDDINDNAPIFTIPKEDFFAYPVARVAERLLVSSVLQVSAYDLDAGLNAAISFSVTANENFDIDQKTGRIFPLRNALKDENPVQLEILATDRDGAEDGNQSKLNISIVPVLPYQLSLLELSAISEEMLQDYLNNILATNELRVIVLTGGYTSVTESYSRQRSFQTAIKLAVVAFDKQNNLVSNGALASVVGSNDGVKISTWNDLFIDEFPTEDCTVYPYIVVMAVFIVLFIAATALAIFWWAKSRSSQELFADQQSEERDSNANSENVIIESSHFNAAKSTPPMRRKSIDDATVDETSDGTIRSKRLARSLSDLLIVDESEETNSIDNSCEGTSDGQGKKSIRFNENVEKIEVF